MGRTLHYEMKKNKAVKVTDENWDTIDKITQHYVPSQDDEGNGPGALFTNSKTNSILPVL